MKDLKHIKRFNESDENLNISGVSDSKDLVIKVKHLVKYLQDNFDMDAKVTFDHMMEPEYLEDYPVDEIDYLDKLGTFQNYKGDITIMGKHIQSFNEHSKNEKLDLSDVSDSEITKFNKLSHKDKIKYLVGNFGMEKVEAEEICPDAKTKVSDLPKEIKSYFK